MIDFDILKKMGSTKEAIRELFTAEVGHKCRAHREAFEKRLEGRIQEGISVGLKNYKIYAVADLAWDSQPLMTELFPLMAYAQGKIDVKQVAIQLKDVGRGVLEKFAEFDKDTKQLKSVNVSKFLEINVNLVRSYLTRRVATLAVKYTKLYPFYRYEPMSTSYVAKLRGDVTSQRMEIMTNQYGYRHDFVQALRNVFMYGHQLEFVDGAWDCDKQLKKKVRAAGMDSQEDEGFETEAYIVRESVRFRLPHPTRTFCDNSSPKAAINTDTGPDFMGFWDVVRFKEVDKNPMYFNRKSVAFSDTLFSLLDTHRAYFELYFATSPVNFPRNGFASDLAGANDREKNIGCYSSETCDSSVALANYFERVIPKDVGIGDYPYPVWLRLIVANGRTVIYGEFLPDTPGVYWGYNECDARQVNASFLHEILPFQDQMSNILNQLLLTQRASQIRIICANLDLLTKEQIVELRAILKGDRYTAGPLLVEFLGSELQDTNLDIDDVIKLHEASMTGDISTLFTSMVRLLELCERVLNISAQEQGQSERREISATQTVEIANTTNTVLSYMGLGVDEAQAAKKRLLFNSMMALNQDRILVPVVNRYRPDTIRAAGFEIVEEKDEASTKENLAEVDSSRPKAQTVLGTKQALNYAYNFTSRDGSERPANAKAAELMVNMLAQLANIDGLLKSAGKEQLYAYINEFMRISGIGADLQFKVEEGESAELPEGDAATESKNAIEAVASKLIAAIEADRARISQIEAVVGQMSGGIPATPMAAAPPAVAA